MRVDTLLAGFRPIKGYDIDQPTMQEVPSLFLEGLRKTYEYGAKQFIMPAASPEAINAVRIRVPEKGTSFTWCQTMLFILR